MELQPSQQQQQQEEEGWEPGLGGSHAASGLEVHWTMDPGSGLPPHLQATGSAASPSGHPGYTRLSFTGQNPPTASTRGPSPSTSSRALRRPSPTRNPWVATGLDAKRLSPGRPGVSIAVSGVLHLPPTSVHQHHNFISNNKGRLEGKPQIFDATNSPVLWGPVVIVITHIWHSIVFVPLPGPHTRVAGGPPAVICIRILVSS